MEKLPKSFVDGIIDKLVFLYKGHVSEEFMERFFEMLSDFKKVPSSRASLWDEKDAILITYGDSICQKGERPLSTLRQFLENRVKEVITCVHILPFCPYSSDDGFSVKDFEAVNPDLGDWDDIESMADTFDLMFDLVINHASRQGKWFEAYLKGNEPEKDYFIEVDPITDLSDVIRPRSLPLLTKVATKRGERHLWTTFSEDQMDLNFSNPEVLKEMVRILLLYISYGARIIRLDAIAFLWKRQGSTCLHLPETHMVVRLMRDIVNQVAPHVIILTETNVPNKENLSYFGSGDEAHMVYQFSLPPLLLHALNTGNGSYLTQWAQELSFPSQGCTFFNFTASHDGIGVRPLEGLLPDEEKQALLEHMKKLGGHISTRIQKDGTHVPYEMNITYFDALKETCEGADVFQEDRFICSQAVMMSLIGVPALYIHSLLATPNYHEGVTQTGRARTINRRKWDLYQLEALLEHDTSHHRVLTALIRLLQIRGKEKAFHPDGRQWVEDIGAAIFCVLREYQEDQVLVVANLTNKPQEIQLPPAFRCQECHDIITGMKLTNGGDASLVPYQILWIKGHIQLNKEG